VKKISKLFDYILNENLGLPSKNKNLCEENKDMKQRLETLTTSSKHITIHVGVLHEVKSQKYLM